MNKLLNMLGFKPKENKFMDIITGVVLADFTSIERRDKDSYTINDGILVDIEYFDDGGWSEIDLSYGYRVGKGFRLILRNYVSHSVIVNHEILGVFHTIEFDIPTESFMMNHYRVQLDAFAEDLNRKIIAMEAA